MKLLSKRYLLNNLKDIENIIQYFCVKINRNSRQNLKKLKTLFDKKVNIAYSNVMEEKVVNFKIKEKGNKETFFAVVTGSVAGLINGLFGGGGGMIVVPMLVALLKRNPKTAHATAILIILPLSIVSGLLYVSFGNLKLNVGIPVVIGVVIGGVIGALLLKKLSSKWIIIIFSVVMAGAGVKMLFF